jgi:heat shock protein HslJ
MTNKGRTNRCLSLVLISGLAFAWNALPGIAQSSQVNNSWLDRPLVDWNRPSLSDFPRLPNPVAATHVNRCRESARPPTSDADRALTKRNWILFGAVQSFGITQLITATSGFDGMCRPVGYQAFIYVEGRHAGTLSPVLMDSRTDGALAVARLMSATAIQAEFVRYSTADALCCPSRTSAVMYRIRPDEIPELVATHISTRPNAPQNQSASTGSSGREATLFGDRWRLTAIGKQPIKPVASQPSQDHPYLEFDSQKQQFFGSSGCNRVAGSFKHSGPSLELSQVISTRRACIETEAQRVETEFLQALETVTRFQIQANWLRLYAGDQLVLVFQR